ncbi:MAG: hypothetical protein H6711_05065 [Myxococcales bacterium]|nr:hypothetical protein [Myxococcales bacterium]
MLSVRGPSRPLALLLALVAGACHAGSERVTSPEFVAHCDAEVLGPATPTSPEAAEAARAEGASWSNEAIREVYLCTIAGIDAADRSRAAEGASLEARARAAFEIRHGARLTARAMMADQAEVEALRARDLEKYGNPDGPTFESLVAAGRAEGKGDDAIYRGIIESSQRTNRKANSRSGL